MELQGAERSLEFFACDFSMTLPPLARIASMERRPLPLVTDEKGFSIRASEPGDGEAAVTVDSAICADCLAELRDSGDHRHGHPFITCTHCGPRFSIVQDVPYDRGNTTMMNFPMCRRCKAEYKDPQDRRFHAQPICCPDCGPTVELLTPTGRKLAGNAIARAAVMLLAGKIVAIKGLGGIHLAVRADRRSAVSRLRKLKQRDSKPFALMVADVAAARRIVELSRAAEAELHSPAAPIILATRRENAAVVDAVAPGMHRLGVMLAYTPLHHLLFDAMAKNSARVPPLVMTSGNLSDEPLAIDNSEALARLGGGGLCDALLLHDRPIERCVEDSVLLDRPESAPLFIRRSRGYVPTAWPIPEAFAGHPTGICLGGELKNTIALVRERDVIVSQHLGDLQHPLALEHFKKAVRDFTQLFNTRIQFVAHDLHPNYLSTHFARELAAEHEARLMPVQHHLAHAHAVLAENAVEDALALACDGTGYGTDGSIWGGELLHVTGKNWQRLGHLCPIRLPGGDAAALDTRRSALALLQMAFGERFDKLPAARRLFSDAGELKALAHMLRTGFNAPWTTSTGRLFDGIAALLGLCEKNAHEAQAPMELEAAAAHSTAAGMRLLSRAHAGNGDFGLPSDLCAFIRHLVAARENGAASDVLAAEFHWVLARHLLGLVETAAVAAPVTAHLPIALGGGTFVNQILTHHLREEAARAGRVLLLPRAYPAGDGGLSFGQAVAVLQETRTVKA